MITKRYLYPIELIIEIPDNVDPDSLYIKGSVTPDDFAGMIGSINASVEVKVNHIQTGTVMEVEEA